MEMKQKKKSGVWTMKETSQHEIAGSSSFRVYNANKPIFVFGD